MRVSSSRIVKIKLAIISIAVFGVLGVALTAEKPVGAFSSGPPPGYSFAPGENSCTDCHGEFQLNEGDGSVTVTGIPHDYFPGQQIQLSVTTSQVGATAFGFQLTAIDASGNGVGTFTVPGGSPPVTQVTNPGIMGRRYVEHTSAGLFTSGVNDSNTWTFTWTAPSTRVGKVRFYVAGNGANGNGETDGDYIYATNTATLSGSAISNFDGDFASEVAYFRPKDGSWYSLNIQTNATQVFSLGVRFDRPVPGDYDGDAKTDFAVFRPNTAEWKIQRSTLGFQSTILGQAGDIPVQGDYDGDGKTDLAVFRASTGAWIINRSTAGPITLNLGQSGDKPAQGDYDADGKTDIAVYRQSNGTWYINRSTLGSTTVVYGTAQDRPVQADYDGDGRTDVALYRPSTATWYLNRSTAGTTTITFGVANDIPAPADYDADGLADLAVFHPKKRTEISTWQIKKSTDGSTLNLDLGRQRDIPAATAYLAP